MLPELSQKTFPVVCEFSGLGTLDPKHDSMRNYRMLVANLVIYTKENVPLHTLFRNVSYQRSRIPKKMVLTCLNPNPLDMVSLLEWNYITV